MRSWDIYICIGKWGQEIRFQCQTDRHATSQQVIWDQFYHVIDQNVHEWDQKIHFWDVKLISSSLTDALATSQYHAGHFRYIHKWDQEIHFWNSLMYLLIHHMILISNDQHGIIWSLARRSESSKLILHLKNEFLGPFYVCFDIYLFII